MVKSMKSFNFLNPGRIEKPRTTGITMVLDKGLGLNYVKDLMNISGEYIDLIKLGWGTAIIHDKKIVKDKVEMYKSFDIVPYPGGTLFELAYADNKLHEYFKECEDIGFETLEISDGSIDISSDKKLECIEKACDLGFKVISEVGKKNPIADSKISIEDRCDLINKEIEAGSFKVIVEARESGKNVGIYDNTGKVKESDFRCIVDNVPKEKIIWEAPQKDQQVYFILNEGANVNLGNISPQEVTSLETLRRGLRGDTLGKI